MVSVSVSQLKARLSEHLRLVKGGEEVVVTERGRPVAVLTPVPPSGFARGELEALVEMGLVRAAKRRLDDGFWRLTRPRDPDRAVLDALLEERREGR